MGVKLTLRDLKHEAAKHGGHIEDDSSGKWTVYQCCAPTGFAWQANDCHHIRVEWEPGQNDPGWKQDELAYAVKCMAMGVRACDPDCECFDEAE